MSGKTKQQKKKISQRLVTERSQAFQQRLEESEQPSSSTIVLQTVGQGIGTALNSAYGVISTGLKLVDKTLEVTGAGPVLTRVAETVNRPATQYANLGIKIVAAGTGLTILENASMVVDAVSAGAAVMAAVSHVPTHKHEQAVTSIIGDQLCNSIYCQPTSANVAENLYQALNQKNTSLNLSEFAANQNLTSCCFNGLEFPKQLFSINNLDAAGCSFHNSTFVSMNNVTFDKGYLCNTIFFHSYITNSSFKNAIVANTQTPAGFPLQFSQSDVSGSLIDNGVLLAYNAFEFVDSLINNIYIRNGYTGQTLIYFSEPIHLNGIIITGGELAGGYGPLLPANSTLTNSIFQDVRFNQAQGNFIQTQIADSSFVNTAFNGVLFDQCQLQQVAFEGCIVEGPFMNNSTVTNTGIGVAGFRYLVPPFYNQDDSWCITKNSVFNGGIYSLCANPLTTTCPEPSKLMQELLCFNKNITNCNSTYNFDNPPALNCPAPPSTPTQTQIPWQGIYGFGLGAAATLTVIAAYKIGQSIYRNGCHLFGRSQESNANVGEGQNLLDGQSRSINANP